MSPLSIICLSMALLLCHSLVVHATADPPAKSTGGSLNPIDACWRSKSDWSTNRQDLASCAVGFGSAAMGGKGGKIYVVTDNKDVPAKPEPGSLRYGVIQAEPLWITFEKDMVITLESELVINSAKTIDGRGAKVEIANGSGLVIRSVKNVIVHGISVHDIKPGKGGMVRTSPTAIGRRHKCQGDAINVHQSTDVWIDHCYLARGFDGLTDVTFGSTRVTISNNYYTQHDKVMLLGSDDAIKEDVNMKVTVAFNHFAGGLTQRMPRARFGFIHVANNRYDSWKIYAIGGSADPTIVSEGNYFVAPKHCRDVVFKGGHWGKVTTSKDVLMNNAVFKSSVKENITVPYAKGQEFAVADGSMVPSLTANAGPLTCTASGPCK